MAKYRMQVDFKKPGGTVSRTIELEIPDHVAKKLGNSNYKNDVVEFLQATLPSEIGGSDWRKNGQRVVSYNSSTKL
jgi:hypothetical protein